MPRIPVRTEPYTSPSRQHRHFKNKRDQVLRALGKAAYINGSHFAIMWVSARGDVETYASDALQGRLDDWFVRRGISEEAKELVRASRPQNDQPQSAAAAAFPGIDIDDDDVDEDDDDIDGDDGTASMLGGGTLSASVTPNLTINDDVFTDPSQHLSVQTQQARLDARSAMQRSASAAISPIPGRPRRALTSLDTNIAQDHFKREAALGDTRHLAIDEVHSEVGAMPHSAPLRGRSSALARSVSTSNIAFPSSSSVSNLVETTFQNEAARTAFLELRFGQLQQGMCKTVSKAWIKIIEPKKQTRCPYNKGEEGKPEWWPLGVRHKEPDHLMKPERHSLLLTILRSPKVKIARLQLATAEVVALMKADKVSLLMDVYRIAREEETRRHAGGDMDAPMKVAVSTIEGWSESEQCAIVSPDRAGSPSLEEETSTSRANRKRPASSTPLTRSASMSSGAVRSSKRLAGPNFGLGLDLSGNSNASNSAMLEVPAASNRRMQSNNGSSTWLLHEATQHGIKRTSVSSHQSAPMPTQGLSQSSATASSSIPFGHSQQQQQQGLQQNYGLMTPLTTSAQLMDPSFLTATHHDHPFGSTGGDENRFAGYMSAPTGHAQLFPHGSSSHFYNMHAMRPPQSQTSAPPQMDNFSGYHDQGQQQMHRFDMSGDGGALGLQGVSMPWNLASSFGNYGGSEGVGSSTQGWWEGSSADGRLSALQMQGEVQHHPQASPQHHQGQALRNNSSTLSVPQPGVGDGAFDTSFASTIESGGPATPPEAHEALGSAFGSTANAKNTGPHGAATGPGQDAGQLSQHGAAAPLSFDAQGWMYAHQASSQ